MSDQLSFDAYCLDCGHDVTENGEDYMVQDEVWEAATRPPHHGKLCIGCLEQRIGRQLIPDDFTHCVLNVLAAIGTSTRLRRRITGGDLDGDELLEWIARRTDALPPKNREIFLGYLRSFTGHD